MKWFWRHFVERHEVGEHGKLWIWLDSGPQDHQDSLKNVTQKKFCLEGIRLIPSLTSRWGTAIMIWCLQGTWCLWLQAWRSCMPLDRAAQWYHVLNNKPNQPKNRTKGGRRRRRKRLRRVLGEWCFTGVLICTCVTDAHTLTEHLCILCVSNVFSGRSLHFSRLQHVFWIQIPYQKATRRGMGSFLSHFHIHH